MSQENKVPKKSNPKVIVIALSLICIILAASLVGVIAIYQPNGSQAQLAEKDSTISSLQAQVQGLESTLNQTAKEISYYMLQNSSMVKELSDLNYSLTTAYEEVTELQQIVQLNASGSLYENSLTQDPNATTTLWNDQLAYAGYVVVQATASANTTYAQATYSHSGYNFDYNQTLGTSGTVAFPVLPGAVEIRIGNINQTNSNSVTATVTYYY
jgi:hypothetical protein